MAIPSTKVLCVLILPRSWTKLLRNSRTAGNTRPNDYFLSPKFPIFHQILAWELRVRQCWQFHSDGRNANLLAKLGVAMPCDQFLHEALIVPKMVSSKFFGSARNVEISSVFSRSRPNGVGGECPNQSRHACFGDASLATKRIWANQICRPLFGWKVLKKLLFLYIENGRNVTL